MSKPLLHRKYQIEQLDRLDKGMAEMLREGIPMTSTPFRAVWEARAKLQASFGYRLPRPVFAILKLYGLSPGVIQLWLDAESGYFTEARAKEGAPPIYHHVTDDVAMAILKGEFTHELEAELMTPDDYIGE